MLEADIEKYNGLIAHLDHERLEIFKEAFNLIYVTGRYGFDQVIDILARTSARMKSSTRVEEMFMLGGGLFQLREDGCHVSALLSGCCVCPGPTYISCFPPSQMDKKLFTEAVLARGIPDEIMAQIDSLAMRRHRQRRPWRIGPLGGRRRLKDPAVPGGSGF